MTTKLIGSRLPQVATLFAAGFCVLAFATAASAQTSETDARLKNALKRFPAADTNKDGILTMGEVRAFQNARRNRSSNSARTRVEPTHSEIAYGPHKRHRIDLWLAKSKEPTPLLMCIHGGGFKGGDKSSYHTKRELIETMHAAGISVATMNYRLTDGGKTPMPAQMHDGARAIQFLRLHADKYNLHKTRFAATGGSAGACMSMWLAFHDDLADPDNTDPVLRESSRITAAAPNGGQSTLHPKMFQEWFGSEPLVEHPALRPLFAIPATGDFKITPELDALMTEVSPITHLTKDDAPCYLTYGFADVPVGPKTSPNVWVHHPRLGIKLKEAMDKLGLECHVQYKDGPKITAYKGQNDFLIRKLTENK